MLNVYVSSQDIAWTRTHCPASSCNQAEVTTNPRTWDPSGPQKGPQSPVTNFNYDVLPDWGSTIWPNLEKFLGCRNCFFSDEKWESPFWDPRLFFSGEQDSMAATFWQQKYKSADHHTMSLAGPRRPPLLAQKPVTGSNGVRVMANRRTTGSGCNSSRRMSYFAARGHEFKAPFLGSLKIHVYWVASITLC